MPLSAQIKQADMSHPLCKVLRKRSSSMVLWTGNTGAQWRDGETWVEWMSGSTLGLPGQIATDTALQAHRLKGHPCITNPCPSRGKRDKWASLQMACVPKMQWSGTVRGWSCGEKCSTNESTGGFTSLSHPVWGREQLVEVAASNCHTSRRNHEKRIRCLGWPKR